MPADGSPCTDCEKGQYLPEGMRPFGLPQCLPCPRGKIAATEGTGGEGMGDACADCDMGKFANTVRLRVRCGNALAGGERGRVQSR